MISIDKDTLIYDILDKLTIPDLLRFLSTNKELREKYLPYFQEKIDDYQENLKYRKEVAIPKQIENFQRYQTIAQRIKQEPLIFLSDELSSFMGLNHIPTYDNFKIYNQHLLRLWWTIYISQTIGHLVTMNELFRLTDEISDLIQVPKGTTLSFSDFLQELRDLYDYIPPRTNNKPRIINIPDSVIEALVNEYGELQNILFWSDE